MSPTGYSGEASGIEREARCVRDGSRKFVRRAVLAAAVALVTTAFSLPVAQTAHAQSRCFSLERQLQALGSGRQGRQAAAGRIRAQLRQAEGAFRTARRRIDRANCYSTFFFTQSLRNTPRCVRLDRNVRRAEGRVNRLRRQLQSAGRPVDNRARRAQIIRALARNRCGAVYAREARRLNQQRSNWNPFETVFGRDSGLGNFFDNAPRELPPDDGIRVGSTYRTMCVRRCDGYYFPISFSTLPSRFSQDAARCQSSCAAPTDLFVYRNPGAEVEQMVSLDGEAYSALPNAFRYRKEFIKGCSCRERDFNPLAGTQQASVVTAPVDEVTRTDVPPPVDGAADASSSEAVPGDAPAGQETARPAPPRVDAGDAARGEPAQSRPAPPKPGNPPS
ncbi:MAG: DUF2865 domain-containing protein [Pseudomonadota bacterium]